MNEDEPERAAPASTPITRYAIPLAIFWSGLLLSAFVYNKLPEGTKIDPLRGAITFAGVPAMSLLGFLVLRLVRRRVGAAVGRGEDIVVAWVMTFLLGMHCLVLGLALGMVESLERALPLATGLLFVGLGPVLGTLEHGSAMGIRTPATLASPDAWRKTHRLLGVLFPLAGIAGFTGFWLRGWPALVTAAAPGVIALAVVIAYAATRPIPAADEQAAPEPRPTVEGEGEDAARSP